MTSKRPLRYYLIYLITFPADLVVWLSVIMVWILWGTKIEWNAGLWCELKPESWPSRSWYRYKQNGKVVLLSETLWKSHGKWLTWGGTCLGHGGFYGPGKAGDKGIDTRTEYHEHIHVEQSEVALLTSFLQALTVGGILLYEGQQNLALVLGCFVWVIGLFLKAASGWVVAWLRGKDPYRGSIHEEAAYSLDEKFPEVLAAEEYEKTKRGL